MSSRRAVTLAILGSAVFTLALVNRARGVTFLWDDWTHLARLREPWPGRWLHPVNEHWKPLYLALFELEHRAFGAWHLGYLLVTWGIHLVNVGLMARLLGERAGDARAGAIGAAAFGVATAYREVLWWAELGGLALCLTICLAGFLAAKRHLSWVALAVFAAPLAFGSGLALGPALALELWFSPRRRSSWVPLAAWGAALAVYALATTWEARPVEPDLTGTLRFAGVGVGLGIVRRVFLVPHLVADEVRWAWPLAGVYAGAVAVFAWRDRERRRQLLLANAWLALVIAPAALARGSVNAMAGAWSRYQYVPALAWATVVALAAARWPRAAVWVVAIVLLGLGHLEEARRDERPWAPGERRREDARVATKLVAAAGSATGPVFDAHVPITLAWRATRASDLVRELAPGVAAVWTRTRTEATTAPYRDGAELERLLAMPE